MGAARPLGMALAAPLALTPLFEPLVLYAVDTANDAEYDPEPTAWDFFF